MTQTRQFALGPHDMIVHHVNEKVGLELALAVHRAWNGRSIGGCRVRQYSSFEETVQDAQNLSHAMTQKNLLAHVPFGGAKIAVNADPQTAKTPEFLHAIGEFVDRFGGFYVTAPDSGITSADLETIAERTPWVVGYRQPAAVYTSAGVLEAIHATAAQLEGTTNLSGATVLVQGVGNVGAALAARLHEYGAELVISDVNSERVTELAAQFGARVVQPGQEDSVEVDIFAPCGLGGVLTEEFVGKIKARAVCGAANNQLAHEQVSRQLHERGVLYAPDFVANSGGVIAGAQEIIGFEEAAVSDAISEIRTTMTEIFDRARGAGLPTTEVAVELARERLLEER